METFVQQRIRALQNYWRKVSYTDEAAVSLRTASWKYKGGVEVKSQSVQTVAAAALFQANNPHDALPIGYDTRYN
jgi:hypothetical protein